MPSLPFSSAHHPLAFLLRAYCLRLDYALSLSLILTAPSLMHFLFLYFSLRFITHPFLFLLLFLIKNLVFLALSLVIFRICKQGEWQGKGWDESEHQQKYLMAGWTFSSAFTLHRSARILPPLFMHQFLWIITNFIHQKATL